MCAAGISRHGLPSLQRLSLELSGEVIISYPQQRVKYGAFAQSELGRADDKEIPKYDSGGDFQGDRKRLSAAGCWKPGTCGIGLLRRLVRSVQAAHAYAAGCGRGAEWRS